MKCASPQKLAPQRKAVAAIPPLAGEAAASRGALRIRFVGPGLLCLSCAVAWGQPPADQAPQNPPAQAPAPQTPAPPKPAPQNPRNVSAKPDNTAPDDIDRVFVSAKGYYWLTSGTFHMTSGKKATSPGNSTLPAFGDSNKHAIGGMVTFPAGKYNRLEVSYYQVHGSGTTTATQDLSFYGQNFASGDFIASSFRVRQLKATWNYLTWPAPPETARLRIKTLWEFQWTAVRSVIDAPYETSATFTPAVGTNSIYYPTFGVGAEYVVAKSFYFDSRASGFAFPHHAVVWDAEANAVFRYKFLEVFVGYKASHLKTSPQQEEYITGTLQGGYGGLRIVLR